MTPRGRQVATELSDAGEGLAQALHGYAPVGDAALAGALEAYLDDARLVQWGIPPAVGELRFVAAQAVAAERAACGIDRPVVLRGVRRPLTAQLLGRVIERAAAMDDRGASLVTRAQFVADAAAWPRCDLTVPDGGIPRARDWLDAETADAAPVRVRGPGAAPDEAWVLAALADANAAVRVSGMPAPLSPPTRSAAVRAALVDLLADRSIAPVTVFGSVPVRGVWLGEVRYAAAWALAWEYRAAGLDDVVSVRAMCPVATEVIADRMEADDASGARWDLPTQAAFLHRHPALRGETIALEISRRTIMLPRPDLARALTAAGTVPVPEPDALAEVLDALADCTCDDPALEYALQPFAHDTTVACAGSQRVYAEVRWFVAQARLGLRRATCNPNRIRGVAREPLTAPALAQLASQHGVAGELAAAYAALVAAGAIPVVDFERTPTPGW